MAIVAIAAQSASAGISVTKETNVPCPPVFGPPGAGTETTVTGGCLIHGSGEMELRKHVFGIESHITKCKIEFHQRVNSVGEGWKLELHMSDEPQATCARQPCKDGNEMIPWHAVWFEGTPIGDPEGVPPSQYQTTTFCVEQTGGGSDETCEIDAGFNQTAATHVYEFGHVEPAVGSAEMAAHGISGFRCELVAHWTTEVVPGNTHDGFQEEAVEIRHT